MTVESLIESVELAGNGVWVSWTDGKSFSFHPIWLRERCPDADTLDPRTRQRKIEAAFLPLSTAVRSARREGPTDIRIAFDDGLSATYDGARLRRDIEPKSDIDLIGEKQLWDGTLEGFPTYSLSDFQSDKGRLLDLLNDLARLGCVLINDVPAEKNGILEFANLIGNIKLTNWGGVEDVRYRPDAFDLTLTDRGLEPHVDNPYRFSSIGYVILHCLDNSAAGGESTVVDGFAVAERLRREDPAAFETLCATPVYFRYEDESAVLENQRPLIAVDAEGRLRSVCYSNRTEFVRPGPVDELHRYYAARRRFAELLYSNEMTVRFRLEAGQAAMVDNYRILHGRRPFDAARGGRHLRQAYMDRDMVSSRQKVLLREHEAT